MKQFEKHNPGAGDKQLAAVRRNMEELIAHRLRQFPGQKRQIVGARIVPDKNEGKERIEVVSARIE